MAKAAHVTEHRATPDVFMMSTFELSNGVADAPLGTFQMDSHRFHVTRHPEHAHTVVVTTQGPKGTPFTVVTIAHDRGEISTATFHPVWVARSKEWKSLLRARVSSILYATCDPSGS
ncbi:hypothetical protein [Natronoglycomyces albus]|uniref:Uncharacterized protein n=1 Tax=Natronoglycomyces albus TaxID=2811108 RepID=A0A895XQ59_9ACTN|nr:hypothetical protein [Natronoglycomyces albus]QSB05509.1 hypothetical protein JQS30_00770 [Natronoglycomyces albus]